MTDGLSPETRKRLSDILDNPEEMERITRSVREKMLADARRREDEEYARQEKILGICPHCHGDILEKTRVPYTDNPRIGGPPLPQIHVCYYCKRCSTMFIAVPNLNKETTK